MFTSILPGLYIRQDYLPWKVGVRFIIEEAYRAYGALVGMERRGNSFERELRVGEGRML